MSEEQAKCPTCEGEGSYWYRDGHRSRRLECAKCQGTGRIVEARGSDAGPRSTAAHRSENAARLAVGEVLRATTKFPTWPTDPLHALAVVQEEVGELTKEVVQLTYEPHKSSLEAVRAEAIQTAAMALRFLMSLDAYEFQRGAQHSQNRTKLTDRIRVSRAHDTNMKTYDHEPDCQCDDCRQYWGEPTNRVPEPARSDADSVRVQRVGRRREKPPLRMWLVVEPVLEVPELQAWCPVSLHHDEREAKVAAHRLGGGRKAVRAFVDFHVPKWESPTAASERQAPAEQPRASEGATAPEPVRSSGMVSFRSSKLDDATASGMEREGSGRRF